MKIKVFAESDNRITGQIDLDIQYLDNDWIRFPLTFYFKFKQGEILIKKDSYLSIVFENLLYPNLQHLPSGAMEIKALSDINLTFDEFTLEFYTEDKKYSGDIHLKKGSQVCVPAYDFPKFVTSKGLKTHLSDEDYLCFTL